MTQALEAAKHARDRDDNVSWARTELKEARSAFEAGDYTSAMERADLILGRLGPGAQSPGAAVISAMAPEIADLGAAAGRIAVATESVKQAKAHGFNVHAAKAVLKEAKKAFKAKDYPRTVTLANEAVQLGGSTSRARP